MSCFGVISTPVVADELPAASTRGLEGNSHVIRDIAGMHAHAFPLAVPVCACQAAEARRARPFTCALVPADVLDSPGLTSSYQPWSPGASQLPASLYSPSPVKTLVFHPKQADSGKHAHAGRVAAKQEPLAAHGSWSALQEAETPPRCDMQAYLYLHVAEAAA